MKIVIVEDEPLAAERLSDMLLSLDATTEIIGSPRSVKESVKLLSKEAPDLVFLDVQLSDGLCFEIFDKIVPRWPVIFTTAYDQYAIKAFKLHSIDYLLKPIKKDALASSLLKYHQAKRLFQSDVDMLSRAIDSNPSQYKSRFLVETGQKIRTVDVGEIAYFMAREKAVYMVLSSGQRIPVDYALDRLEQLMDPDQFFRINRKFMITIKSISSMTNYSRKRMKVVLNPSTSDIADTLVSIEKAADFRSWLDR